MITRKIPVVWQAEMRRIASPDEKGVVLIKDKAAPGVRA
jgi:hypothetical protein